MENNKKSIFVKKTFVNLFILVICIVFVTTYKTIFGDSNSIIGVTLLIGFLIMMNSDLGFNSKQASLSLLFLYVIIAFAPRVSLISPYIGLLVNACSILLILMLSTHTVSGSTHIALILGYFFSRGYYVPGKDFVIRSSSLVVGGLLIAIMYYVTHRNKTYKRTLMDIFKEINLQSTRTRWHLKLTILMTLVLFVGDLLNYPRSMWIAFAVFSLIQPFTADSTKRMIARIPAVAVGTFLFYLIYVVLVPEQYQSFIMLPIAFIMMYFSNYFASCAYSSFAALSAALTYFPASEAIFLRLTSNIIGTIVAIVGFFTFNKLFSWIDQRMNPDCSTAIEA